MSQSYDPIQIIKTVTTHDGDTREEYMTKLRGWCAEANQHNVQTFAVWQNYYMQFQLSSMAQISQVPPADQLLANYAGYYMYTIPSMWKRFAAELLDFLVLFVVKMFLTILMLENLEFIDFEKYTLSALEEQFQNPMVITKLTLEIFILEIAHRIIVCLYEAYWLASEGATPGKKAMGLAVVHVVSIVQPTAEIDRVLVHPSTLLSFKDALVRALLKNICVGFLFPVCFVLLYFKFNRTGYDLLANCIVVERDPYVPPIVQQR